MKKFFKSIFTILCLSLVALVASVFMLPKAENQTYAIDDNTHIVNFYSSNNLLYSINVNNNTSLQQLENNNILLNSNFADSSSNAWFTTNVNTTLTYLDNGGMIIASSNGNGFVNQNISNSTNYYSKNIAFSVSINGNIYTATGYVPNGFQGVNKICSISNVFSSLAVGFYIRDNGILFAQFGVSSGNEYLVNWVKVEIGTSPTPYFSEEYITKLYRNENNLTTSDVVMWSTADSAGEFDFNTPITKDTNIYGYEDVLFSDKSEVLDANVSYQESYYLLEKAIDNIEYIRYKGSLKFIVTIDTSKISLRAFFMSLHTNISIDGINTSGGTQSTLFSSISLSYVGFDNDYMNVSIESLDNENCIAFAFSQQLSTPSYDIYLIQDRGKVVFTFTTSLIDYNDGFVYEEQTFYDFYNGKAINDMNSNTNYFLNVNNLLYNSSTEYNQFYSLISGQSNSIYLDYSKERFNNTNKYLYLTAQRTVTNTVSSETHNIYSSDLIETMALYNQFYISFYDEVTSADSLVYSDITSGFSFSEFDIIVQKPVARVDNSLVIYNFGFNNFLQSTSQIKYELRRGNKYYDVVYNGSLENYKMIVIDSEQVRNSLYDEYIILSFLIDGNNLTTFDQIGDNIGTYLGFDFNFVYYTQPLIAGGSSYDLMQYRPEYMDGTPSLVPFNIPFTAWVYNAFLWLIFDCPLISDLIGLLHLNLYFGSMINLLNFYVNSPIGDFVMACFTFIIFWAILKFLMPSIVGGLVKAVNDNYEEREFLRNETNKLNSRYNKISSFKGRKGKVKFAYKPNALKRYKMRNMVYKTKVNRGKGYVQRNYKKKDFKNVYSSLDDEI